MNIHRQLVRSHSSLRLALESKKRYSSASSAPSVEALHAHFRSTADVIARYQLHLEPNPARLDELVKSKAISQHMADFFKKEICVQEKAAKSAAKMSYVFYYIGLPLIFLTALNAYYYEKEHHAHMEEHPVEHTLYPYIHMRATKFPFGDGEHTLFFNPKVNYDPKKA